MVDLIRRVLFVSCIPVSGFLFQADNMHEMQCVLGVILSVVWLCTLTNLRPYDSKTTNTLAEAATYQILFLYLLALLFETKVYSTQDQTASVICLVANLLVVGAGLVPFFVGWHSFRRVEHRMVSHLMEQKALLEEHKLKMTDSAGGGSDLDPIDSRPSVLRALAECDELFAESLGRGHDVVSWTAEIREGGGCQLGGRQLGGRHGGLPITRASPTLGAAEAAAGQLPPHPRRGHDLGGRGGTSPACGRVVARSADGRG